MNRTHQIINVIELDCRDIRFQSGIARYFDTLAANMPEYVQTFKVIFYHSPTIPNVSINVTDTELQVFHPAGFPMHTLFDAALAFIGHRLDAMENLIVKSNCLGMEAFAYLLRNRFYCKTIGVLHCLPHLSFSNEKGTFPALNPLAKMDSIILVCQTATQWLDRVHNKRPHNIIYNGIRRPKIKSRKKPDDVFKFIWTNGWAAHKGLGRIIPAIRQVAKDHKIQILVLGGGQPDEKTAREISDLPIVNVGLLNDSDKIAQYYEQADCALFASYSEACSFAGIEAMSYNLPIISSDAAGLVEMFGSAALYAKTDKERNLNVSQYADNMNTVIENARVRSKLAVVAYARYLERYTAQKMAKNTLNLYKKLLD